MVEVKDRKTKKRTLAAFVLEEKEEFNGAIVCRGRGGAFLPSGAHMDLDRSYFRLFPHSSPSHLVLPTGQASRQNFHFFAFRLSI